MESAVAFHVYGAPAHRLESATQKIAETLSLDDVQILSLPTSIHLLVQRQLEKDHRLIRVHPGDIDISRLQRVDAICEQFTEGQIGVEEGLRKIREVRNAPEIYPQWLSILSFAIVSGALALILGSSWDSALFAGLTGGIAGIATTLLSQRPETANLAPVIAAVLVAVTTVIGRSFLTFDAKMVTLTSLIVLIPGLSLTTALVELATENLVAGTARLMGAMTVLLKLFFGAFIGFRVASYLFPMDPSPISPLVPSGGVTFLALSTIALSLTVLFKAHIRQSGWVLSIAIFSFATNRLIGSWSDPYMATLIASTFVSIFSNLYARWSRNPASTLLLPGIILLVPGSLGYRSLIQLGERDILGGMDYAFQMIFIAVLITGGLLIGQFVAPPKKAL